MTTPQKKNELLDALEQLELCLETPVVPGEMERWTTAVERAFSEAEPLLIQVIENEHPQKMEQISEEDPALLRRVEQLKEQDREISENLKRLREQLEKLDTKAESVEPDEQRIKEISDKFVSSALAFIIQVRKQEAAIDTWLMEALDRDRGVAD